VLAAAGVMLACSGTATSTSSATSPSVVSMTRIELGVLGSVPPLVRVGDTLQLFATGTTANGTTSDLTTQASWSSGDSAVAIVSSGAVTGRAPGIVKIAAAYGGASGTLDTTVAVLACATSTLSPPARVFSATATVPCSDDGGQYGERVTITASQPACRWSAVSDASWLGMDCFQRKATFTPSSSGSGVLFYKPDFNSTPSSRTGHIIVTFDDGSRLVHTVSQEPPACSMQLPVGEATVPRAGGSGAFDLVVTPASCEWVMGVLPAVAPMVTVSQSSGTGSQRITYQVPAFSQNRDYVLIIASPRDLGPSATFVVHQRQ